MCIISSIYININKHKFKSIIPSTNINLHKKIMSIVVTSQAQHAPKNQHNIRFFLISESILKS